MIKNTIIIILLLLLLITFYAYICLSTNMIDFQKERMEHIAKKEVYIKQKEQKLLSMTQCNDNLNKYKNMIGKITNDISKTSDDMNNLKKYATQINNSIHNSITTNTTHSNKPIPETSTVIVLDNNMSGEKAEQSKEHFGVFENFNNLDNFDDLLDLPIDDGFLTGLDK